MKRERISARGKLLFCVLGLLWYPAILFYAASVLWGSLDEVSGACLAAFLGLLAAGELGIAALAFFGWRKHRKKQDEEQEK